MLAGNVATSIAELKLAYSVEEAGAVIGISRTAVYEVIRQRKLTARKIGSRTVILRDDLLTFLTSLPITRST